MKVFEPLHFSILTNFMILTPLDLNKMYPKIPTPWKLSKNIDVSSAPKICDGGLIVHSQHYNDYFLVYLWSSAYLIRYIKCSCVPFTVYIVFLRTLYKVFSILMLFTLEDRGMPSIYYFGLYAQDRRIQMIVVSNVWMEFWGNTIA